MRALYIPFAVLLLLAGLLLGSQLSGLLSRNDAEQLRKLEEAFLIINKRYVEDLDPQDLADNAIRGMLESLDPHSSYIDAEIFVEVEEGYRGSFGGIGIWFEVPPNDTARVVSLIEGGPSERTAMRPGDRIIAVNDTSIVGMSDRDIRHRIKGPIGTSVTLSLQRPGVVEPLDISITRGSIPLYSVTGRYMVDAKTGYIKISRFSQTTAAEFHNSVRQLKEEGMERLILDLRQNPGGVLEAAVEVVDELLVDDQMIVYTEGHNIRRREYHSRRVGLFEQEPVIVLINHNSVSASEVVAGALQDQDRALIIGQPSYGKGLVQSHFVLPDDSRLELVTARYFTPSGRLIQTPYNSGDHQTYIEQKIAAFKEIEQDPGAYREKFPDSLKYTTTHKRTVLGGGGILPDVFQAPETAVSPFKEAIYTGVFLDPFYTWFEEHEQVLRTRWYERLAPFMNTFAWPEDIWADLFSVTEKDTDVSVQERLFTADDVETHQALLDVYLKSVLTRQLFGSQAALPLYNQIDPLFLQALSLWDEAAALPGIAP